VQPAQLCRDWATGQQIIERLKQANSIRLGTVGSFQLQIDTSLDFNLGPSIRFNIGLRVCNGMVEELCSFSCRCKTVSRRLPSFRLRSVHSTVAVGSVAEKLNQHRIRLSRGYADRLRTG